MTHASGSKIQLDLDKEKTMTTKKLRDVGIVEEIVRPNEHYNLEYEIGQRWEIEADRPEKIIPPHVENVVVRHKRPLPPERDLPALIAQHMPIYHGGPQVLYEGRLQTASHGALYICQDGGVPAHSTTFWRPDRPLTRDTSGKRIHYRFCIWSISKTHYKQHVPFLTNQIKLAQQLNLFVLFF